MQRSVAQGIRAWCNRQGQPEWLVALVMMMVTGAGTWAGRWLVPVDLLGFVLPIEGPLMAVILYRFKRPIFAFCVLACLGVHLVFPGPDLDVLARVWLATTVSLTSIGVGLRMQELVGRYHYSALADLYRLTKGTAPFMLAYGFAVWPLLNTISEASVLAPLIQAVLLAEIGLIAGITFHCFVGLPVAFWRFRISYVGVPMLALSIALGAAFAFSVTYKGEQLATKAESAADMAQLRLQSWFTQQAIALSNVRSLLTKFPDLGPLVFADINQLERRRMAGRHLLFWLPRTPDNAAWDLPMAVFDPVTTGLDETEIRRVEDMLASSPQLTPNEFLAAFHSIDRGAVQGFTLLAPVYGLEDATQGQQRQFGIVGVYHEMQPVLEELFSNPDGAEYRIRIETAALAAATKTRSAQQVYTRPFSYRGQSLLLVLEPMGAVQGANLFRFNIAALVVGLFGLVIVLFMVMQETGHRIDQRLERRRITRMRRKLERAQAVQQEAQRMASLGAMVAGISHEVNTPLSTAKLGAENLQYLLRSEVSDGVAPQLGNKEHLDEIAGQIVANLQRAADLMNNFKRISSDRGKNRARRIDLGDYISQVIAIMNPRIKSSTQSVTIRCAGGIKITTVPGSLSQALIILLDNALKHAYPDDRPGTIEVAVSETSSGVCIVVSDDGVGVEHDQRDKVFRQFFSGKADEGESGLGLYLAQNLVRTHLQGNLILAESSVGARFEITLPRQLG